MTYKTKNQLITFGLGVLNGVVHNLSQQYSEIQNGIKPEFEYLKLLRDMGISGGVAIGAGEYVDSRSKVIEVQNNSLLNSDKAGFVPLSNIEYMKQLISSGYITGHNLNVYLNSNRQKKLN